MRPGVIACVLVFGCGSPAAPSPPAAPAPPPPPDVAPPDVAPIEAEGFVRAETLEGTLSATAPTATHAVTIGEGCAVALRVGAGPALTLGWPAEGTDAAVACAGEDGAMPLSVMGPPGPYRIAIFRAPRDETIDRSIFAGGVRPMVELAIGMRVEGRVPSGPWRRVRVDELDVDRMTLPADSPCWTIVLEDPTPVFAAPVPARFDARLVREDGSVVATTSGDWLDACAAEPEAWTLEVWRTAAPVIVRAYRAPPPETWSDACLGRVLGGRVSQCQSWLEPRPCLAGTPECEAPLVVVDRTGALAVLHAPDCEAVDVALGRPVRERELGRPVPPVRRAGTVRLGTPHVEVGAVPRALRAWLATTLQPALLACYERELAYHEGTIASGTARIATTSARTFFAAWADAPGWLAGCAVPHEPIAGAEGPPVDVEATFAPAPS